MSNTLLPCPFCGGEAEVTTRDVEPQGDPWYGKNIQTFVICTNCGACLFDDYFHEGFADEHEATTAWNRRANLGSCENELIVRCENCKHYNRIGCLEGFGWCESMDRGVSDDFYCANGTKMESEGGT